MGKVDIVDDLTSSGTLAIVTAMVGVVLVLRYLWDLGLYKFFMPAAAHQSAPRVVATLVVGLAYIILGTVLWDVLRPTPEQAKGAALLILSGFAGMVLKWVWDATERSPFELDTVLFVRAIAVYPITIWVTLAQLKGALTISLVFVALQNGFCCQTIAADVTRRLLGGQSTTAGEKATPQTPSKKDDGSV